MYSSLISTTVLPSHENFFQLDIDVPEIMLSHTVLQLDVSTLGYYNYLKKL